MRIYPKPIIIIQHFLYKRGGGGNIIISADGTKLGGIANTLEKRNKIQMDLVVESVDKINQTEF